MGIDKIKKPAVFLDRDGTIVKQVDELTDPSQLELFPGAAAAIAELDRRGFLVIVLTNQPIVEKGLLSPEGLENIHDALRAMLGAAGARLDGVYTCPHRYRAEGQCACRKPGLGLIEQAQKDFDIDMTRSWCVGDRLRDMETGRRAHIKTILVRSGGESDDDKFFPDAKFDHVTATLGDAVRIIEGERG
ncbi:MAG TPA: HAD family hydrolase [Candidatus Paceibacterota bacterium]|nr:HAD family hydrolase [Candidatus Paceibacterota bacterium]